MTIVRCCLFFAFALLGLGEARNAVANIAGGGTGAGANVTMVNSGGYVTLDNGIVNVKIKIATGQISYITYNGFQFTDGFYASANGTFYWQGASGSGKTLSVIKDPATNGGNIAEISIDDTAASSGNNTDAHYHFTMLRGSQGIYVTQIATRNASAAAGGVSLPSLTGKLSSSSTLNWLAQDGTDPRNQPMQSSSDTSVGGVSDSPKEVTLLTSGSLAGQFDCKYDFAGDLGTLTTTGWCGTSGSAGIWILHPSDEYLTNGPMHREILSQWKIVQATFSGVHFGFNDDNNFSAGETWSKVLGPFFIYVNKATGSNPQATMFADAQAQAQAERGAWPYTWFSDSNYAQALGRGAVTGKIVINDTFNPNASAANLWVGVAQQPPSATSPLPTDFQFWGKRYQYWVKTDSAGNFTIPNVVAGSNYTLFAFGPGAIGQFQSQALSGAVTPVKIDYLPTQFAVNVVGGQTTALGTLTWTPARIGPTVFEIGVPDRNTQEFRHGDDYWHGEIGTASAPGQLWAPFQFFPYEWPNGLGYTVGQSHWATDWNYAQPTVYNPSTAAYNGNTWTITFTLPNAPTSGTSAFLYLGIASDETGPVIVKVNNTTLDSSSSGVTAAPDSISTSQGFFVPSAYENDAMIRMSSHGIFCDERLTFPTTLLKAGTNTITLNMRKGGYFANSAMYDYVRLELPGYIPPAPAKLTTIAGSGVVQLRWTAAPGATSYKVLRSVTSGSGYTQIVSGVTGAVAGSTPDTVSYSDTNAANGATYYYVVQSVNTVGTGSNSMQASATPSASAPGAPSAPSGLVATPGNMQVTLNWTASTSAAYYVIKRSLTSGGPYAVINDTATANSYTDLGRSNGMTYYYVVDAVNIAGSSSDSTEATTRPMPPATTVAPSNLTVSNNAGSINLTWTVSPNATGYTLQRAASVSGSYASLTTTNYGTTYTDTAATGNTTYYYKIAASNLAGDGAFSSSVSITTPPDAPTSLTATGGSSRVALIWTASAGATSYNIGRSTTSGGSYTIIASNVADITYVDRTVSNRTTYYYVIAANGIGGTGANSTEVSATPAGVPTLTWTGSVNSTWNTTTANWLQSGTTALYVNGDGALFDDTASTTTVVLSGTMSPDEVVFGSSGTYTFTAAGLSGATGLTKLGTGTLNISGSNNFTGGTYINGGSVVIVGGTGNGQNGLGSGPITLQSGTLVMNGYNGSTTPSYGTLGNAIKIPAASAGTFDFTPRGSFTGTVTGSGTLTLAVNYVRGNVGGDWSGFTGRINVIRTSIGTNTDDLCISGSTGFGTAAVDLGPYVRVLTTVNASNIFIIGQLSGDINSSLTGVVLNSELPGPYTVTYAVGGRNTNATFAGSISNGTSPSVTAITKEGAGTWILSGSNNYTGPTIVNKGILSITGTLSDTGSIAVASGSMLTLAGGSISMTGPITNNGVIRITGTGGLFTSGTFTNNGVLDLINAPKTLPTHFINNGTVIDSSAVAVSSISMKTNGTCTISIRGYASHTYQLQSTPSLTTPNWQNVGNSQTVSISQVGSISITLADSNVNTTSKFYRVVVTPAP